MLRKALIGVGVLLGIVVLVSVMLYWRYYEPLPRCTPSSQADSLARCMMASVDKAAWDSLRYVSWSFMGQHDYVWDKWRYLVEVRWKDRRVVLHTNTLQGKVWIGDEEVVGKKANRLLRRAWTFFCNDSYWLNPVVKAFDPGTQRCLVTLEDGRQGLMVHYSSGGVTPGDSYVWILDNACRPLAWKMWVQVIPIGGVETTWEGWQQLPTGAWVATCHGALGRSMEMIQHLRTGNTLAALGLREDPFAHFRLALPSPPVQ